MRSEAVWSYTKLFEIARNLKKPSETVLCRWKQFEAA